MSALQFTAKSMSLPLPARALMALAHSGCPSDARLFGTLFLGGATDGPCICAGRLFRQRRTYGDGLRGQGLVKFIAAGLITQLVVVAVLFLVGRGVSAIIGGHSAAPFEA